MLPAGTISIIKTIASTATTTLLTNSSDITIISFFVNHAFNSETDTLSCGNTPILKYAQSVGDTPGFPVLEFIKTCNQNIYWKSGSTNADNIILNYLPYNIGSATTTPAGGATTTDVYSLIQNSYTGAEFYVNKSISYGDTLLLAFVLLFCIMGIVKSIADFIIPKRTDFKR